MMYRFRPNQFVENGAAVLAERARVTRLTAHKYELTRRSRVAPAEVKPFELAA